MIGQELKVGIGDMKLTRGGGTIITYALGSCIGISIYDPMLRLGALIHIMLPEYGNTHDPNIFKYADTGIRETVRKLTAFGLVKSRAEVKIAGGAKMFEISGNANFGNIGQRTAMSVKRTLLQEGFRLKAEDVGGSSARTMSIDVATGAVKIKVFGRPDLYL